MITRCDHCGSRFQVSSELIQSDDPQVRCGECMSLFDARLNLYNEAESRAALKQYKPVRRRKAAEVAAEQAAIAEHQPAEQYELETADTVSSEHFFTRSASEERSYGGPIPSPDVNLDSNSVSSGYRPYRFDQSSVADVEFERTMATEASIASSVRESRTVRPEGLQSAEQSRRQLAERERRALAMEPGRELDEQQMRQLDEHKARSRDHLQTEAVELKSKPIRTDHAFIPDDVLEPPSIYRDNGRRDDDMRFKDGTPQFETRSKHPATTSSVLAENSSSIHQDDAVRDQPQMNTSDTEMDKRIDEFRQADERRFHEEKYTVRETSAQEMRRYKQHRPEVAVSEYVEPVTPRARRPFNLKPLLWTLAVIAGICVCVFAARNIIANSGLPDSVVSRFCGVTGCVPAEAKKDVSQLELVRSRVFPHPDIVQALIISVDLTNNSVYKQPYPVLDVQLLNDEGSIVGERSFTRFNYEVVDRDESEFLMPGEPTRIKIELVDSGLGATDMELQFK